MQDDNVLQEMIERADYDQDGLVSLDEFYNLLTKKAYWQWSLLALFMALYYYSYFDIQT